MSNFKLNLLFGIIIWPTITYVWLDSVDPPYINNYISNFFIWWVAPALVLSCYLFVVFKYNNDKKYRNYVKNLVKAEFKTKWFYYLISPIFLYVFFYIYLAPNFIFASYYFSNTQWTGEYVITETRDCGTGYENSCIKIYVSNTENKSSDYFRWYEDKHSIHKLVNQQVQLSGVESYGRIVERIEW